MISLYAERDGRLRFAGKDRVAETLALAEIIERRARRVPDDRLHAENMAMLGASEPTAHGREPAPGRRPLMEILGLYDKEEEALWRAWRAYSV